MSHFPKIILWAWERPEDLDFINPLQVGVAYLAETIYLSGPEVVIRPRLQPLKVPQGTFLIATARIETNHSALGRLRAELSAAQRAQAATAIAGLARIHGVQTVQIDFDATTSERPFYRDLLNDVRGGLPDSTALSITALGSWCMGDDWLARLPIDEAVPMLFRMGVDGLEILSNLRDGGNFDAGICNQSLGISTDEPLVVIPGGRRVYIFRPSGWSQDAVRAAVGGLTP